ncbi:MAG: LytTR family DNA-binding domain-containing protein [Oscillospiraceae bacterium]|jgi:DNA-binding LytR/AlgR family response regulator|nr:LytTR family DNA-binding domain-containing protein [Oscillospiraceae bacterium]
MQIAIVDDSASDRQTLRTLLRAQPPPGRDDAWHLSEYAAAGAFLADFRPGRFQIVFLDIYLGGEDGMETARAVRAADPDCRLVFFTGSRDHAVDSYLVRASYYLTKPVEEARLRDALLLCCEALRPDDRTLAVHVGGARTEVPLRDLCYLDCQNRRVRLHLHAKDSLTVSDSLAAVSAAVLADARFLCCNKGVIVNLAHVWHADAAEFVLTDGRRVPLRIHGRGALKKAFLAYSLQDLGRRGPH